MLKPTKPLLTGAGCVLLAVALHAQMAVAAAAGDPRSIKVPYAELDLSKQAGAQELYQRIRRAARTVCGSSFSNADLARYHNWQQCYQSVVDEAVRNVDRPLLSTLHEEQVRFAAAG